jgi:hypothetical protein
MAERLFFSQDIIQNWCDDEKITFKDNILTIQAAKPRSFQMVPAFRFVKVEGQEQDKMNLVGQIKTDHELEQMGADRYMNSCICSDIPYELEPGYIAEMKGDAASSQEKTDEELLTEFLLANLIV